MFPGTMGSELSRPVQRDGIRLRGETVKMSLPGNEDVRLRRCLSCHIITLRFCLIVCVLLYFPGFRDPATGVSGVFATCSGNTVPIIADQASCELASRAMQWTTSALGDVPTNVQGNRPPGCFNGGGSFSGMGQDIFSGLVAFLARHGSVSLVCTV